MTDNLERQYQIHTLRDGRRILAALDGILAGDPRAALSEYDLSWLRAHVVSRIDAAKAELARMLDDSMDEDPQATWKHRQRDIDREAGG